MNDWMNARAGERTSRTTIFVDIVTNGHGRATASIAPTSSELMTSVLFAHMQVYFGIGICVEWSEVLPLCFWVFGTQYLEYFFGRIKGYTVGTSSQREGHVINLGSTSEFASISLSLIALPNLIRTITTMITHIYICIYIYIFDCHRCSKIHLIHFENHLHICACISYIYHRIIDVMISNI